MRRVPASVILATLSGIVLGLLLAFEGLQGRLFGDYLVRPWTLPLWRVLPERAHLEPGDLAWPMVVLATGWFGTLGGLWQRLRWAYRSAWLVSLISLAYLGLGTALALIAIVCLAAEPTRRWLSSPDDAGGS